MGTISVMGRSGDTKIVWNPENTDEVEAARKAFKQYRDKGFMAYRAKAFGKKGEQIFDFDAEAESIVFVPPIKGG